MTEEGDTLFGSAAQQVYRDLFLDLYEISEPAVRLGEVIHWSSPMHALGLDELSLNQERAFFAAGYFYSVHTPPPGEPAIAAALEAARSAGALWLVYPVVPRSTDTACLASHGFTRLPWFIESRYHVRRGVESDLRTQLGGDRLKKIRRNARRVRQSYDTEVVTGADIARHPSAIADFARLHALNLIKYEHKKNHFSARAVEILLSSPLSMHVVLFLKRARATGRAVQAALNLVDDRAHQLLALVQGIDHAQVPSTHNLYTANYFDRYSWGAERGICVFNLGRGGEHTKRGLGANAFTVLDIHMRRVDGAKSAELFTLRSAAEAAMNANWQGLTDDDGGEDDVPGPSAPRCQEDMAR